MLVLGRVNNTWILRHENAEGKSSKNILPHGGLMLLYPMVQSAQKHLQKSNFKENGDLKFPRGKRQIRPRFFLQAHQPFSQHFFGQKNMETCGLP